MNKKVIGICALALGLIAGFLFYINRSMIFDWFASLSYIPTAEVANIRDNLGLTDRASLMFSATHPELEPQDSFNSNCKSHNQEISVLGCYGSGRIHIYNINDEELKGVTESTAAHELLHAAWARMSNNEKNRIAALLKAVYDDEKYHEALSEDLETYSETDRIEELHSRIGTEIADLPEELEKHYAKYFKDQDYVVEFYNSYITPFKELKEEIEELSKELEKLDKEIEEKTSSYYKIANELSTKIDEFNNCAKTLNCFSTDSIFYTRRNQLLSEQINVESLYNDLSKLIDHYNTLVAEYNENVLRGEKLEQAINSNKEVKLN